MLFRLRGVPAGFVWLPYVGGARQGSPPNSDTGDYLVICVIRLLRFPRDASAFVPGRPRGFAAKEWRVQTVVAFDLGGSVGQDARRAQHGDLERS